MRPYAWMLTLMLSLPAGPAWAQEAPPAPDVAYKRRTVVDFSEVKISGELVKPSTTYVNTRRRTDFQPLIRVRGDFRPELLSSIDAL